MYVRKRREEREKRKRVDGPTEKTSPKTLQAPQKLLRAKMERVQAEMSQPVHRRPGDERTGRGGNGLDLGLLEIPAERGAPTNARPFSFRSRAHETDSNADMGVTTTPETRVEDAPW